MAFANIRYRVFNDTAVKHEDIPKMTVNQLNDERTRLVTVMDALDAKGDKCQPNELEQYREAVERLEAVQNAYSNTQAGLSERRNALLATSRIANATSGLVLDLSRGVSTRPAWEDDKEKYGFRNQQEFLGSVVNAYRNKHNPDAIDPRLKKHVMDAVGSDEFSKANWESLGITVPRGFISTVMMLEPETDPFTALMTRIPMSAPSVDIPARVDKDHTTSVTGGFRVYRGKETQAPTLSKSEMEMITLKAHELNGAAAATNQLMSDSPISIAALIDAGLRQEARSYRMEEFLYGNGLGRPLGCLHASNAARLQVLRENGQSTSVIVNGTNILKMRKRVWGYDNAVWIASLDLFDSIATLHIESPNNAGLVKLFYPADTANPDRLLGRPIIWTEYMDGISSGDGNVISEWNDNFLACINPTQILFGERGTGTLTRSIHVRFLEREEVFLFTSFDDARPWWKTVMTPKRAGLTLSPFVVLSTTTAS
jgi:HK97 family phage major capsid protein